MAFKEETRLRAARRRKRMTLQQIADRAGVSRTVVQSWESGTHVPRGDHVMRVTRVLDLDIEDLFHDFEVRSVPRQVSAM